MNITFLELDDVHVNPDHKAFTDFVFSAAQGQKDKNQIAKFFKHHSEPLK